MCFSNVAPNLNAIGLDRFVGIVSDAMAIFPECKIVSVGSGDGCLEKAISDKIPDVEFICVDPDPTSYSPDETIYMAPQFDTIYDLRENMPELVGNCIVFMTNTLPQQENGEALPYDIEVMHVLRPNAVIAQYSPNGCTGSDYFQYWVESSFPYVNQMYDFEITYNVTLTNDNSVSTHTECERLVLLILDDSIGIKLHFSSGKMEFGESGLITLSHDRSVTLIS